MAGVETWGLALIERGCSINPPNDSPPAIIRIASPESSEVTFRVVVDRVEDGLPHRQHDMGCRLYAAEAARAAIRRLAAAYGVRGDSVVESTGISEIEHRSVKDALKESLAKTRAAEEERDILRGELSTRDAVSDAEKTPEKPEAVRRPKKSAAK